MTPGYVGLSAAGGAYGPTPVALLTLAFPSVGPTEPPDCPCLTAPCWAHTVGPGGVRGGDAEAHSTCADPGGSRLSGMAFAGSIEAA